MEATCGFTSAASAHFAACNGEGPNQQILYGLIFPKTAELALATNLDPLEAALEVYRNLLFVPTGVWLRYLMALERRNAAIVEADRLRFLEAKAAGLAPPSGRKTGLGTRSAAKKRKAKAGRR